MYQLVVYIPEQNIEEVKEALFTAGAGKYDDYDSACWQVKGVGQFKPLETSNPHVGERGVLEKVAEYRVEMICEDEKIAPVIEALIKAHPYEVPAYSYWQINSPLPNRL